MKHTGQPTIILLSAAAGSGHKMAGDNLTCILVDEWPEWRVLHIDITKYSHPWLSALIIRTWRFWSTTPLFASAYSLIHRMVLSNDWLSRSFARVFGSIALNLQNEFMNFDVRAIISLHPAATAAATQLRLTRHFFLGSVATDLIVHGLHALPRVDAVYADRVAILASPAARGLEIDGRMVFAGLPVGRQFHQQRVMPVDGDHVVVSFGGCGIISCQSLAGTIVQLAVSEKAFRFTIVCGTNEILCRCIAGMIEEAGVRDRVAVVGFVDDMHSLLRSAVCLIGKPGGISVGEAMALSLPFGIIDCLPGQEEANARVIMNRGLGFMVDSKEVGIGGVSLSAAVTSARLRWSAAAMEVQGVEAISRHLREVLALTDEVGL